ncbi:hypothetical protein [Xanthomonas citri]
MMMTALRDMHRQTRERCIANNRIIERCVRHCVLRDLNANRAANVALQEPCAVRMMRVAIAHRAYADAVRLAMLPV